MLMARVARVTAAVVAGLVLSTLIAGCTGNGSSGSGGSGSGSKLEDGSGVVAEYRATVRSFPLELPSGVRFPKDPPDALLHGKSEVGVGESPAYFFWLCSWEAEYLKAFHSGDTDSQAAALRMLDKWESTSFVKRHVQDPDGGWHKGVLTPATLGDPSGVQQDMQGEGCEGFGVATP